MRFKTIQPDNPILRAEINYQQRTIPRWLQWFDRFGVIVLALAISLALLLLPIKDDSYGSGHWPTSEMIYVLQVLLWISQLIVIFRCMFAGFNVMRHHRGWQQLDIILLTGITRKQLLNSKFWGALYQLRGWIVAFGILKLTVFAFVVINSIFFSYRSPLYGLRSVPINPINVKLYIDDGLRNLPPINRIVITGVYIPAISMLEIMASAAIGMVSGLIPEKTIGLGVAVILRLLPVISFTLFPDYLYTNGFWWRWYGYTWFSFADGGSTAILRSGISYRGSFNEVTTSILLAFWAAIVMYISYLAFAFLVSHYFLRRQGFLSASPK